MKNNNRAEVELTYMKRLGTSDYYFEVWIRSAVRPDVRQGMIVDRNPRERAQIMGVAAALTISVMDKYGEGKQDPDKAAVTAGNAYDKMLASNPIPRAGDERPI